MSLPLPGLLAMLLVGLAGSVHCVGMCGGIVSAFSLAPARAFPVAVVASGASLSSLSSSSSSSPSSAVARTLAYNSGRLASYSVAGALAGGVGSGVRLLGRAAAIETVGLWAVSAMLVMLGLYLMDVWRALAVLERLGGHLWRRLEPVTAALLPLDSTAKLVALGAVWGWLPCGMVYSALMAALASGSAGSGAALMLAFGLGTLPMLLAIGVAGARLRTLLRQRTVRLACGALVLGFGVLGMARAAAGAAPLWLASLCGVA